MSSLRLSLVYMCFSHARRVREFQPAHNLIVAEWSQATIAIDILLLPVDIVYRKGSLFQFLGELEWRQVCLCTPLRSIPSCLQPPGDSRDPP